MKTPKYILWTDHKAAWNSNDRLFSINAGDIIDAMKTASVAYYKEEETLWAVTVFQRVPRKPNLYRPIMRTRDGENFTEHRPDNMELTRYSDGSIEWV